MRALFVGRFNPFHKGHLAAIEHIFQDKETIDEIIIIIGSAEKSHSLKNPFTAGERLQLIKAALKSNFNLSSFHIIPIRDMNRYAVWVAHVESYCPPFNIVYSNNPTVSLLFQNAGYKTSKIPLLERKILSGTKIRQMMFSNDSQWKELVPPEVMTLIETWEGVKRLQALTSRDLLDQ
ncbi:MAG: nicotinamide-nucleotide adenylyltransferase [Promethearchaeota archaeon]